MEIMENASFKTARILTIDQGNSSAKAVVWVGGEPVKSSRLFDPNVESLLTLLEEGTPDGCIYCSVGHTDARFLESLRILVDGRFLILTPSTPLPIGVVYDSRQSLGNDRVAAAAGAAGLFPGKGALVVDAGTAVTIDVLSPEGFRGGNIAPGMLLRFESLKRATDRLPLVSCEGEVPPFGHDTPTAIRAGVVGGMVSEIADAFFIARETYSLDRIIITGADAPVIAPILEKRGLPVVCDPNLVGRGLLSIYNYVISSPDI